MEYQCEYLNGEKNGKEYMYSKSGEIESTKQYLNGKLNWLIKWNAHEYDF